MARVLCLVFALLVLPVSALAQDAASLIADNLRILGSSTIVAEGNVEIFYQGSHLKADRVTYDRAGEHLDIEGPVTLTEGDSVIVLADSASLDADLRNGVMRGARMVLDQQLQLAAAEMTRVGGRYTQLYKTVASSCQVCANNPVPLWQIRAERIVHDQQERQLYFDNAQFRVMNIPVMYLPRLRLPDPTLERATGFLTPSLRSTSQLGFGLKIPYFIAIGDDKDLTITPYFSSSTKTLELRYRQAFRTGTIEFEGAFSRDDILRDQDRWYLFGEGSFNLPRDYKLNFDIEATSDSSYLLDYGYSDADRLDSAIELSRTRRDQFFSAGLVFYETLRTTESNSTIPSLVTDIFYQRRFEPSFIGGDADLRFQTHSHSRRSSIPGNLGRDVARASAGLEWRKDWILRNGMVAAVLSEANLDFYDVAQGAPGEEDGLFHTITLGSELRWPWAMTSPEGASHIIEPVVQLLWTNENIPNLPNEDSTLLEFDEGNLFALTRYPGTDAYERGFRANIGATWTRFDPAGWSIGLTAGRIFRAEDLGQFTAGSGLTGSTSDWLAALQLKLQNNLSLTNRALFDDTFDFTRNETRVSWRNDRLSLASTYVWLTAAPAESRPRTSEWIFDSSYRFDDRWTGKTDWRYDFVAKQASRAGVGLEYQSECVKIDLSLSRRFTSSTIVTPTTDFGLTISLSGFGASGSGRNLARSCTR